MLVDASLQFPTVVFTLVLCIALLYWVFVLLGALDLDVLGSADHGDFATGAAKGGAEALKGHGADGAGFWNALGLASVPLTISISLIALIGWAGSLLVMSHVAPSFGGGWIQPVLLPVMLVAAVLLTSVLVRPLAPLFAIREGKSNRDYIGHTCTISTGSVDDDFGQATVEDGGTVLVIPVRCDRPGKLARNDKALIIDFDQERQAYVVEPSAEMLAVGEGVQSPSERT